jgi:hypothetical protein
MDGSVQITFLRIWPRRVGKHSGRQKHRGNFRTLSCDRGTTLTQLSRAETLAELTESRQVLEKILGRNLDSFALPYRGPRMRKYCGLRPKQGIRVYFSASPRIPSWYRRSCLWAPWRFAFRVGLLYRLKVFGAYQWLPVGFVIKRRIVNLMRNKGLGRPGNGGRTCFPTC